MGDEQLKQACISTCVDTYDLIRTNHQQKWRKKVDFETRKRVMQLHESIVAQRLIEEQMEAERLARLQPYEDRPLPPLPTDEGYQDFLDGVTPPAPPNPNNSNPSSQQPRAPVLRHNYFATKSSQPQGGEKRCSVQ